MSTAQQIGVPAESRAGETRVAATPKTVEQLRGLGYDVVVETGAGAHASFADDAYEQAGARVARAKRSGAATSSSRSTRRPTRSSPACATARSWPA